MERRAGIEPANTGFADLRVNHFATGAFFTYVLLTEAQSSMVLLLKTQNPPAVRRVGHRSLDSCFFQAISPRNTPAVHCADSSTDTSRV